MKKKFVALYGAAFIFAGALFFAFTTCAYGVSPPSPTETIPYFQNIDGSILLVCSLVVLFLFLAFGASACSSLKHIDLERAIIKTLLYLYAAFSVPLGVFFEIKLLSGVVRKNDDLTDWQFVIFGSLLVLLILVLLPLVFIWEQLEKKLLQQQKQKQNSQTNAVDVTKITVDVNPKVVDATNEFDELLKKTRQEMLGIDATDEFDELLEKARQERQARS